MQGIRDMEPEAVLSGLSGANHVQGCLCQMTIDAIWVGGFLYAGRNDTCRFQRVVFYVITCRIFRAETICSEAHNQCL